MKIKELHIRNIASIEKADINFDQDILDNVTNVPASIFLISGDTGTGKSVLLDSIAMALYKKTPRIAGVANVRQNEYTNTEGQSVSINSIEQYTRLGISEKDDCYSELVFEGNDGRIYHAKLKLGLTKGRANKNGNCPLKYSEPQWTCKVDNEDWQKVDGKGQPILDAVGLSFEQFGRMAMLAQGQFASFLTGKKEERESILEQLTNTAIFTDYGNAISALYKKAKSSHNEAQTRYDAEKGHTLSPEEVAELNKVLTALQKAKEELDTQWNQINTQLKDVQAVNTHMTEKQEAEKAKGELTLITAGETYKKHKTLVADWDATNSQRKNLADKKSAEDKKNTAEQKLKSLAGMYAELTADLAWRQAQLEALKTQTEAQETWLSERQALDKVYTDYVAAGIQLEQYHTICNKLETAKKSLTDEQQKTPELTQKKETCSQQLTSATAAVTTKKDAIDQLRKQREDLHPAAIQEQIQTQTKRKNALEDLQKRITAAEQEKQRQEETKQEIENDSKQLEKLQEVYQTAQRLYEDKKQLEEQASKLLSTMKMSVEETLTEIRQRLVAQQADSCPLCGQHINHAITDVDFTPVITPLQQQENNAKAALAEATQKRDKAKSEYDTSSGALTTKKNNLQAAKRTLQTEQNAIEAEVTKLGLKSSMPLAPQIITAIKEAGDAIEQLAKKQTNAENLLKQIENLTNEKQPLEDAKNTADRELLNAQHAVDENDKSIKDWTQKITGYEEEKLNLHKALEEQLETAYPNWATDTEVVKKQLEQDAQTYIQKKKDWATNQTKAEGMQRLNDNIGTVSSQIEKKHPDWPTGTTPHAYATTDILAVWVQLNSDVDKQDTQVAEAKDIINHTTEQLNAYYQATGKTEENLLAIIQAEPQVADARKYVTQTDADLKSREDAIRDYNGKIDELKEKLKITDWKDLPEESALQESLNSLNEQIQGKVAEIGAKQAQLNTNQANEKKLAEAAQALEKATTVYNKWDRMNSVFGGTRFRTLVQTYILRPLLNNANIYLREITDRYILTCSEENEQLSILVLDRYNKNQVRSVTVLSGGERFMISLALSLALSSLNRQDMNVNILFIDEGFGTLDETNLNSVMSTLEKLQDIAGQTNRRVGIISHREELVERIPVKIHVKKKGEGRSVVEIITH